jgi:uncharacterized OB-fold protein
MNPFPVAVGRTDDSAEFFDMAARGAVMLRRCLVCAAFRGPQEVVCGSCHHTDWEPVVAEGAASLVSWTVVHRSPVPGLEAPYTAALVECREGPWMFVRLLDSDGCDLHAGMAVELITAATGEDGESIVAAHPMKAGM